MMSDGTGKYAEKQKLKLECTKVNYSEIQRSQVAALSSEKVLAHLYTLYESSFSENVLYSGPQCPKQIFLNEYFKKENMTWPQLAVVCIILSNCLRLWCDGK